MRKQYCPTKGARFSKKKAQVYGECLEQIEKSYGELNPRTVVDEAKSSSSPLHNYFDWNNTSAAEKFRVQQAREMINHLTIVVNYETGEEIKAFFSVTEEADVRPVYVNIERALSDPALRKQVIENAFGELKYWQERYKQYSEFRGIVRAIASTGRRLKRK